MPYGDPIIDYDKIYESTRGEKYKIIEFLGRERQNCGKNVSKVKIKFLESGYEKVVTYTIALKGLVKDPYTKATLGIGYIGELTEEYDQVIYNRWYKMLNRCYNPNDHNYNRYGGRGVYVCERWHCFANFLEDFKKLPGYQAFAMASIAEKNLYHLDKDYLQQDSEQKVYSPETCMIIHASKNSRLANRDNKLDYKYLGVKYVNSRYEAHITDNKIIYKIGRFYTAEAAASAYNYVMRYLPKEKQLFNEDILGGELSIENWFELREPDPIQVPYGVEFPEWVCQKVQIIQGNSCFKGVRQEDSNIYEAFYHNGSEYITIDYYTTDIAAANAYNYYCEANGINDRNDLLPQLEMSKEEVLEQRTLAKSQYINERYVKNLRKALNSNIKIGDIFKATDGSEFKIIDLTEPFKTSYLKSIATIQYLETGSVAQATTKAILLNKVGADRFKPTVLGIGIKGDYIEKDRILTRIYNLWYRLLQLLIKKYPENPTAHIYQPWLVFTNFLEDFKNLPGYYNFNSFKGLVMLGIVKNYIGISESEWVYGPEKCYITPEAVEEKWRQHYTASPDLPYHGVCQTKPNTFKIHVLNPYTGIHIRSSYTDPISAANMYNYYSQACYGVTPNPYVPYMSYQECKQNRIIGHKKQLRQLYTRINKQLYTLTRENEQIRQERCLQRYGVS